MKPPHEDEAGCLRWTSTPIVIGTVVLLLVVVVGLAANSPVRSIFRYAYAVGLVAWKQGMSAGLLFAGLATLAAAGTEAFPPSAKSSSRPHLSPHASFAGSEDSIMNEPAWMKGPPRRLLLATDLSARCDRALDRAAQLAREWQSTLVVMTVLETPERPDPLAVPTWPPIETDESRRHLAQRQLQRDVADLRMPMHVRIAHGDAASTIGQAAADDGCDLIVTGMARNELFGRFLLGSTVEQLARTVPQPVLVVRNRAHGRYQRILVATDFSEASCHALHAAAHFFPGRELIVYHAHTIPFAGTAELARDRISHSIEVGECAAFLAGSNLPAEVRGRLQVAIEDGGLESALGRYVREHDVDLAVLGTHGRTGLMNVLLGSTAARLLHWLPCDTMIVRKPRSSPCG